MKIAQIGILGLGTMGANIARNFASKGIVTAVYNRSADKTEELVKAHGNDNLIGHLSIKDFIAGLEKPRNILLMVTAGPAVDAVITELVPLLEQGDTIIDGGNSLFTDTQRRTVEVAQHGLNYIGLGVSGGEEGALNGPSMMAGELRAQSSEFRVPLKGLLEKIAAKDFQGSPCLGWFGGAGSGHYVKMVHNGIEYAIMQLIAETYQFLRQAYGFDAGQIGKLFAEWQKGRLNSYLIDITSKVLQKKDELAEGFLIDQIKDAAGQKGTGQWTVQDAFSRGIPIPSIVTAVEARQISSFRAVRLDLAKLYSLEKGNIALPAEQKLETLLFSAIVLCYVQGLTLIATTAKEQSWEIDLAEVVRIWQGGCIIRATLLKEIAVWVREVNKYSHLLAVPLLRDILQPTLPAWKECLHTSLDAGIPMPCFQATYQYFLAMQEGACSANMIQGLRDFFGAHTYERVDREGVFHTVWEEI